MSSRRSWAFLLTGAAFAATNLVTPRARAAPTDLEVCAEASEAAQSLRREGKLGAAHERLAICAQATCPDFIQKDCATWIAQVEKDLPSIVVRVLSASGMEVTEARVLADGKVVAERLDGRPIFLEPGEHGLAFEVAGAPVVTETIAIKEGETNRVVSVTLAAPPSPAPAPAPRAAPPAEPEDNFGKAIPGASWALGGVGFALGAFGAVLWSTGTSDHDQMAGGCARSRSCAQSDVDSAKAKLVVGDVLVTVSLLAIGAAVYFALTAKPPASARAPALRWRF